MSKEILEKTLAYIREELKPRLADSAEISEQEAIENASEVYAFLLVENFIINLMENEK